MIMSLIPADGGTKPEPGAPDRRAIAWTACLGHLSRPLTDRAHDAFPGPSGTGLTMLSQDHRRDLTGSAPGRHVRSGPPEWNVAARSFVLGGRREGWPMAHDRKAGELDQFLTERADLLMRAAVLLTGSRE